MVMVVEPNALMKKGLRRDFVLINTCAKVEPNALMKKGLRPSCTTLSATRQVEPNALMKKGLRQYSYGSIRCSGELNRMP